MMRTFAIALIATFALVASASAQADDPRVTQAEAAREAYWQAVDADDYGSAFAMMTDAMQSSSSADAYAADHNRLRGDVGAVVERRVMRTTVYDNPPNAPASGVYVAFDIVARFELADRYCGYIILHQQTPGTAFRVTRVDQTYFANSQAANAPDANQTWQQLATQFCPGWQPSWTIAPPV